MLIFATMLLKNISERTHNDLMIVTTFSVLFLLEKSVLGYVGDLNRRNISIWYVFLLYEFWNVYNTLNFFETQLLQNMWMNRPYILRDFLGGKRGEVWKANPEAHPMNPPHFSMISRVPFWNSGTSGAVWKPTSKNPRISV